MLLRFIHLCIGLWSLCEVVGGFHLFTTQKQRQCLFMSTSQGKSNRPLILGVNKYSHDTSCCFVDGNTGEVLLAQAKERLTGSKHDGGGINSIVKVGLESLGASIDDITTVISNNHHYRVQPFEKRLPFSCKMKYTPNSYLHDHNLLPKSKHLELSHHLAHAWSGIVGAPFRKGLIVVMDGMGESYRAMIEDMINIDPTSGDYMHDLKLLKAYGADNFIGQPVSLLPGSGYREAETAYIFDADKGLLKPVYKRWSRERSPSELYNHGFENMESLGAIYSRISSHTLGDWNACGKIMGLASWSNQKKSDAFHWYFDPKGDSNLDSLSLGTNYFHEHKFMLGNPVSNEFIINWQIIEELLHTNDFKSSNFDYFANIAASIQHNLEDVSLAMLTSLQELTNEKNVILVGGVALNSVLNSKVRESGLFEQVYIPPAPGDEGIAIGCAMYGYHRQQEQFAFDKQQKQSKKNILNFPRSKVDALLNMDPNQADFGTVDAFNRSQQTTSQQQTETENSESKQAPVPLHQQEVSPYQGFTITDMAVDEALYDFESWIDVTQFDTLDALVQDATVALTSQKVIAWFQGRSELGQRALGSRSILADPRMIEMRRFINEKVKLREWYRPLAPSVLVEYVGDWFEKLKNNENASPYMSLTATIKAEKRSSIPAVSHIDGTARLQTVTAQANPLYHRLISAFYKKTKIPMILNTSFNGKNQPIVETPRDAIQAFIATAGAINHLYLGQYKITMKNFPLSTAAITAAISREELDEKLSGLIVRAQPLYLSEVTSALKDDGELHAVRVRIQDGGAFFNEYIDEDEQQAKESPGSNPGIWTDLPSTLHLEILQLLQHQPPVPVRVDKITESNNDEEEIISLPVATIEEVDDLGRTAGKYYSLANGRDGETISTSEGDVEGGETVAPPGELTVLEVYDALRQVYNADKEEAGIDQVILANDDDEEENAEENAFNDIRSMSSDSMKISDDNIEDEETGQDEGISWKEFRAALQWLYEHLLVSFEDINQQNVSPEEVFPGASQIIDLRRLNR